MRVYQVVSSSKRRKKSWHVIAKACKT